MLKLSEILVLSEKMNWDVNRTGEFLTNVYAPNRFIIDGNVVKKEYVDQFFRIICNAKDSEERKSLFENEFLGNFNADPINTIAYFLHDEFFVPIIFFFESVRDFKYHAWLVYESGDNFINYPYFGMEYIDEDMPGGVHGSCSVDPYDYPDEDRRHELLEILVEKFCEKYSGNYDDKEFAQFSTRYKKRKGITAYIIDEEVLYRVYLCSKLVELVGFDIFKIKSLRESIFYCEEDYLLDGLVTKITDGLSGVLSQRHKQKKYFIYALCQKLKQKDYGVRESFRVVSEYLYSAYSSIHRRYYEVDHEIKEKNYSIDEIIRTYKLAHKLKNAIDNIVSEKAD